MDDEAYLPVPHVHPHGWRRELDVENCMVEAVAGGLFFAEEI